MNDSFDRDVLRVAEELLELPEVEREARVKQLALEPEVADAVRRLLALLDRDDFLHEDYHGAFTDALLRSDWESSKKTRSDGIESGGTK